MTMETYTVENGLDQEGDMRQLIQEENKRKILLSGKLISFVK